MKQKWKPTQYIEISIDEIFAFQDKLDAVKDDPEKVWEVVDSFFWEVEGQLELSPNFLKELQEIDEGDFVPLRVDNIDELFDDDCDYESNYATAKDYVNYILYQRKKEDDRFRKDIPFSPRLNF